jgi:hypothetical protein
MDHSVDGAECLPYSRGRWESIPTTVRGRRVDVLLPNVAFNEKNFTVDDSLQAMT